MINWVVLMMMGALFGLTVRLVISSILFEVAARKSHKYWERKHAMEEQVRREAWICEYKKRHMSTPTMPKDWAPLNAPVKAETQKGTMPKGWRATN